MMVFAQEVNRPKIGLVLSGGGAKGFAHVGALKVIDELGIPIDYIGGTSIGSLVGAMYALGYPADSLEKIAREIDWENIFNDNVPRKYKPFFEKQEANRYNLTFPIAERTIHLPSGMFMGQNIMTVFSRLTIPYHNIDDFSAYPIPYFCIAADVATGKEFVFEEGFLAEAIRASIAVPTAFTPVRKDSMVLVDGGVVNNFPVDQMRKMGADIIIGVDLQYDFKKAEEINDIPDVINQLVSIMGNERNLKNVDDCDIYIKPEIEAYSSSEFGKRAIDSLIVIGERAMRLKFDELVNLRDSLKLPRKKAIAFNHLYADTFKIKNIKIEGLKLISERFVLGKLNLNLEKKVSISKLEEGIRNIYGSQNFNLITYQLLGTDEKTLLLNVDEKQSGELNLGIHFDSDNRASLLINATYRNILDVNSRLSADLVLSQFPVFKSSLIIDNGWIPGFFTNFLYHQNEIRYYIDGSPTGMADFNFVKFDFGTHFNLADELVFGFGASFESIDIVNRILDPSIELEDDMTLNYFGFLELDTYDQHLYPERGVKLRMEGKIITHNGYQLNEDKPTVLTNFYFNGIARVNDKLYFLPALYHRMTMGVHSPLFYYSRIGGVDQPDYIGTNVPFIGSSKSQMIFRNALILRADLRYKLLKDHYLFLKPNVGIISNKTNIFNFDKNEFIYGAGLTYSYNSLIGPVELTLMSAVNSGFDVFFNLGFWF